MKYHRLQLLLYFFFLMILSCCSSTDENDRPNIILIFIDDMGYGDLSSFGNQTIHTPNMDALTRQGVKFTNFYVNSPICSPSRVAINTGQYPMRYKIHSYIASSEQNQKRAMANYLNPSAPTLARTLQENGYATGHFGKWHMGGGRDLSDVPHPREYGYEKSLVSFEGIGDRVLFPDDYLSERSAKLGNGKITWADKSKSTKIYVDSALSFIGDHQDKPFFINLCPNDVHDPHLPEVSLLDKYRDSSANPFEQRFYAVLKELDHQIGRFVNELDKIDLLNNTMIILTSDNGPTDWPHYYNRDRYPEDYTGELYPPGSTGGFYGRKWSLYEGGIRMPFSIIWKDHIPASHTDSSTVLAAMDLYPSICTMLGIEYPDSLDGKDKSKALLGYPMVSDQSIMWEYASNPGGSILPGNPDFVSPTLAIRRGDWKLLCDVDSTNIQLFHLKNDPSEENNVIALESETGRQLIGELLAWRRSMPVDIVE